MQRYILAATCGLAFATSSSAETALEMREYCRGVLAGQVTAQGGIIMPQTYEAGICWGSFSAVQSYFIFFNEGEKRPVLNVCLPPETTRRQLVEIFSKYTSEHLEKGHEDWARIAWDALYEAFPC